MTDLARMMSNLNGLTSERRLIENQILGFLEADEGNLEKLVAKLIFEYQSTAANEGTKLDLA